MDAASTTPGEEVMATEQKAERGRNMEDDEDIRSCEIHLKTSALRDESLKMTIIEARRALAESGEGGKG